jgi:sulfur carrier protein ThiS adenylyltransferase
MAVGVVVFVCVDRIQTRQLIWEAVKDRVRLLVDGRMNAEVMRIVTACDAAGYRHYPATLFAAGEAFSGSCTAKSTIYTASIAAGLMIGQFTRFLLSALRWTLRAARGISATGTGPLLRQKIGLRGPPVLKQCGRC